MANRNGGKRSDHPHHAGAGMVSDVFKVIAAAILILGIAGSLIAAFELLKHTASRGFVAAVAIGGILGSILSAAAVAFFAYVLDLLMGIDVNTYEANNQRERSLGRGI